MRSMPWGRARSFNPPYPQYWLHANRRQYPPSHFIPNATGQVTISAFFLHWAVAQPRGNLHPLSLAARCHCGRKINTSLTQPWHRLRELMGLGKSDVIQPSSTTKDSLRSLTHAMTTAVAGVYPYIPSYITATEQDRTSTYQKTNRLAVCQSRWVVLIYFCYKAV